MAFVPVALLKVKLVKVVDPVTNSPPETTKLVVVAEVPVALVKVKSWRVVEPVTRSVV